MRRRSLSFLPLLAAFVLALGASPAGYLDVGVEAAARLIEEKKPLLLDVRTRREFWAGYIPGATLIPIDALELRVDELEAFRDRPILIYCLAGPRSTRASKLLRRKGFRKVYNLKGGIRAWIKAGRPAISIGPDGSTVPYGSEYLEDSTIDLDAVEHC